MKDKFDKQDYYCMKYSKEIGKLRLSIGSR